MYATNRIIRLREHNQFARQNGACPQPARRVIPALLAAILTLAFIAVPFCAAQEKKTDLEAMLPPNTAAFVRGTNLHGFWKALANSPLRNKLENAPIPEVRQQFIEAKNNIAGFEAMIGVDLGSVLNAFLGNDFILALFADGSGVFITRSADQNNLQAATDTILGLERQWGKILNEQAESYHQVEIISVELGDPRNPGMPSKPRHHARIGNLLILSESRDTVKKIIDIMQGRAQSLLDTPEYREAKKLMRTTAIGRLYINTPKLVQSGITEKLANGNLQNPLFKTWHTRIKKNLEQSRFIVANVIGDATRLDIHSSFAYDQAKTPASINVLMPNRDTKLDIARCIPNNTVASFCNSVNKAALWKFAIQTMRELRPDLAEKAAEAARRFGQSFAAMDFQTEFLPQLGDQFALFVTPGPGNAPPALTAAIELTDTATIPQCIQTQIGSIAFINWIENKKKNKSPDVKLTREKHGAVDYTRVDVSSGPVAGKITPTMCVAGKFMIISTSADAARAAADAHADPPANRHNPDNTGTTFTRAHLDIKALTAMLRKHNEFLVREAVKKNTPEQKARNDWRNIEYLLSFLDSIETQASYNPGQIDRTIHIGLATK